MYLLHESTVHGTFMVGYIVTTLFIGGANKLTMTNGPIT